MHLPYYLPRKAIKRLTLLRTKMKSEKSVTLKVSINEPILAKTVNNIYGDLNNYQNDL